MFMVLISTEKNYYVVACDEHHRPMVFHSALAAFNYAEVMHIAEKSKVVGSGTMHYWMYDDFGKVWYNSEVE